MACFLRWNEKVFPGQQKAPGYSQDAVRTASNYVSYVSSRQSGSACGHVLSQIQFRQPDLLRQPKVLYHAGLRFEHWMCSDNVDRLGPEYTAEIFIFLSAYFIMKLADNRLAGRDSANVSCPRILPRCFEELELCVTCTALP